MKKGKTVQSKWSQDVGIQDIVCYSGGLNIFLGARGAKPGIHEDTGQELYYINDIRGSNILIMIEENNLLKTSTR